MTAVTGGAFRTFVRTSFTTTTGRVLFLLCIMYFITYVDRVNLSTAAPVLQKELGLSNTELGFAPDGYDALSVHLQQKKFSRDDETQFLEIKSIIAQGLEAILASTESKSGPKKEEVHQLFSNAPSLRFLSDMPDAIHSVESQWHKIYLGLQSLLGQLKVQQTKTEKGTGWSLFGKK